MKIWLRRQIGFHVVQTYIPSVIFVSLSWLALFVSPESIPGMTYFIQIQKSNIKNNNTLIFAHTRNDNNRKIFFRSNRNGHDNVIDTDCHVWGNTSKCAKGILRFIPWHMDGYVHNICLWDYDRIYDCA